MDDKTDPTTDGTTDLLAALRLLRESETDLQGRAKHTADDGSLRLVQACAEMLPAIEAGLAVAILALGKIKGRG